MPSRKPSAPPAATAKMPALPARPEEAFIGHDAPTRVGISLEALEKAHRTAGNDEKTTALPAFTPRGGTSAVERADAPTEARLSLGALERLAGCRAPQRLKAFFDKEIDTYDQLHHRALDGVLRFAHPSLSERWSLATSEDVDVPAQKLLPLAAAGDDQSLVAADLTQPRLAVFAYDPDAGFWRLASSFDEFIQTLQPEPDAPPAR